MRPKNSRGTWHMKCIKSISFYLFPSTLWLSSIIKERRRKHRIWLSHFRFSTLFFLPFSLVTTTTTRKEKEKNENRQKKCVKSDLIGEMYWKKKEKRIERKIINNCQVKKNKTGTQNKCNYNNRFDSSDKKKTAVFHFGRWYILSNELI